MLVIVEAEVKRMMSENILRKLESIVRTWERLFCLTFPVGDVWLLWKQNGNKKSNDVRVVNKLSIKSPANHHLCVKTLSS